jgi:CPA2 family monovalent cation:H+ antiporter-2
VGKTVASLNLPALGVEISAIRRQGVREMGPEESTRLKENDIVVVIGTQEALAAAEIRLLQG